MESDLSILIAAADPEYVDGEDPSVRHGWAITTAASADWALARMGSLLAEAADIEAQRQAAADRIEARAAKLTAQIQRGVAFFEARLSEYATANKDAILGGGKKKSRSYLSGTIGWRKAGGKLRVTDRAALVAWLGTLPAGSPLYREKREPEMDAIQRQFAETGEIPPGTEDVPETDTLYVKPIVPETGIVKVEG